VLNEAEYRRPDFKGDVEVTLANGSWWIRKPSVKLRRQAQPDGSRNVVTLVSISPTFDAALVAYGIAKETGEGLVSAMFGLVVALLRENYDLTDEALDELLVFDGSDPESVETWSVMVNTARGY
jgi:hypothetical protein